MAIHAAGGITGSATSTGSFGNIDVTGDAIFRGTLTAQQMVISSSVTNITIAETSGSSIFGNSSDDTHQFTGSINLDGKSTSGVTTPFEVVGGTGTSAGGLKFGAYDANFGGIWPASVTPAASNYAFVARSGRTVLNTTTDIGLYKDDASVLLFANSTGVAIGGDSTNPTKKLDVIGTGRFTGTLTTAAITTTGITSTGNISSSLASTGSFGHVKAEHIYSTDDIQAVDDVIAGGRVTSTDAVIGNTITINANGISVGNDTRYIRVGSDSDLELNHRHPLHTSPFRASTNTNIITDKTNSGLLLYGGTPGIIMESPVSGSEGFFLSGSRANLELRGGNVSGSSTSTGSFGKLLGDGSSLTGISSTPFPFTGSANISGSFKVKHQDRELFNVLDNFNSENSGSDQILFSAHNIAGAPILQAEASRSRVILGGSSGLETFFKPNGHYVMQSSSPVSASFEDIVLNGTNIHSVFVNEGDIVGFPFTASHAGGPAKAGIQGPVEITGSILIETDSANSGSSLFRVRGNHGNLIEAVDDKNIGLFRVPNLIGFDALHIDKNSNITFDNGVNPQVISGSLYSTGSFGRVVATKLVGDGSGITGLTSAAISTYNNAADNRIITSVDSSTVQGEANLTFDGTTLSGSASSTGSFALVKSGVTRHRVLKGWYNDNEIYDLPSGGDQGIRISKPTPTSGNSSLPIQFTNYFVTIKRVHNTLRLSAYGGAVEIYDTNGTQNIATFSTSGLAFSMGSISGVTNVTATGNISGSSTSTGSFGTLKLGSSKIQGPLHTIVSAVSENHTYHYQGNGITIEAGEPMMQIIGNDTNTHGGSILMRYGDNVFATVANTTADDLEFSYAVTSGNNFTMHGGGSQVTSFKKIMALNKGGNITIGGNISGSSSSTGSFGTLQSSTATVPSLLGDVTIGGKLTTGDDIIIPHYSSIFLHGTDADNKDRITRDSSANATIISSRFHMGLIIDSNSDDTDGEFTVRANGYTYNTSTPLLTVTQQGLISGSAVSTGSFGYLNVPGNAVIGGNIISQGDITAQRLIVSSSVTNMVIAEKSGSTIFGDSTDDRHRFTGSLFISASDSTGVNIQNAGIETILGTNAGVNGYVGTKSNTPFNIAVNNARIAHFTTGGSLGVGADVDSKVNISNVTRAVTVSGTGATIYELAVGSTRKGNMYHDGNNYMSIMNNTDGPLVFGTQNGEKGRFSNDGKFGIGTNSPSGELHIKSAASQHADLIIDVTTDDHASGLYYYEAGSAKSGIIHYGHSTAGVEGGLQFLTGGISAASNTRMVIDSSGNVGIGTNAPGAKLEVVGNISGSATSTGSFGKLLGDGSSLTGISSTPFPFTGSAGLSGSIAVKDLTAATGSTMLSVQGSEGQLFSVVNSMTGSIFSANTVAGLPVIEAYSDGTVHIGPSGSSFAKLYYNGSLVPTGSGGGGSGTGFPFTGSAGLSGSLDVRHLGAATGSTLLSVNGSEGTLFSVVNSMTGSIFSANTTAGIPVIEAFSDGDVTFGPLTTKISGSSISTGSFGKLFVGGSELPNATDGSQTKISGSSVSTGSFGHGHFVSNVGIGTNNPANTLHVKGTSNQVARFENANGHLRIVNVSVSDNFGSGNRSVLGDNGQDVLVTTGTGSGTPNNSFILLNHDGNIRIAAGGSPGASEGITVVDGGNVGIGTTTPGTKLDVVGGDWNTSLTIKGGGSTSGIKFLDSDNNVDGYIYAAGGTLSLLDSGGDYMINILNDDSIRFAVGASEKMRILNSGNVGIGTANPVDKLHVVGNIRATGDIIAQNYIVSSSVTHMTQSFSSGSTIFGDGLTDKHEFTGSLNVLMSGSSNPLTVKGAAGNLFTIADNTDSVYKITMGKSSSLIQVIEDGSGNAMISGSATSTAKFGQYVEASSIAFKTNVETLQNPLDKISKLRGVTYNLKANNEPSIGMIAEEVNEVFPELVDRDDSGNPQAMSYTRMTAVLLEAVKELKEEVKELKKANIYNKYKDKE